MKRPASALHVKGEGSTVEKRLGAINNNNTWGKKDV